MTKPLTIEELQKRAQAALVSVPNEAQELDAPAYPQPEPEAEPARPTLAERWAEFWRNRRIKQLRAHIQREQQTIDSMPEAVVRDRMDEFQAHELRLREIDALAELREAQARHEIFKAEAELQRLGEH